ncbi:SRPBCC domain-containing protein [Parapedobacter soli]|uniref:SRPBCC domain-containing protein n=1 Tax=Parapedobacter soli TaxID=416955 RepID=UPI0021C865BD|nr:SRPBCC domain-containing protein [Parapedobacter soli]
MEDVLTAKATIQILKPAAEVFEAIVSPDKMNKYFIEHSTGRLETGKEVHWKFPEFDDRFPVLGKQIRPYEYISFDWSGGVEGMLVEIALESTPSGATVVRIVERQMKKDDAGIQQAIGQSEGWANFLACLKAYLEYGINLRKGAFDFMKE